MRFFSAAGALHFAFGISNFPDYYTGRENFEGNPQEGHALLLRRAGPGSGLVRPGGQCQFHDLLWPGPRGYAHHRGERDDGLHLRRRAQPDAHRAPHRAPLLLRDSSLYALSGLIRPKSGKQSIASRRPPPQQGFFLTISDKLFQKRLNSAELDKFIRKTAEAHFIWFQEGKGGGKGMVRDTGFEPVTSCV